MTWTSVWANGKESVVSEKLEVKERIEKWTWFWDKEFKGRCPLYVRRRPMGVLRA